MYVSKEKAKQIIDEAHGMIWSDSFNGITFIHTRPKQITIDEGKRIISRALTIDYEDDDFLDYFHWKVYMNLLFIISNFLKRSPVYWIPNLVL